MKRYLFSFLAAACLLAMTSCMSADEKNKAFEIEAEAQTVAQAYLDTYYEGGSVSSLTCAAKWNNRLLPEVSRKASPFVEAAVSAKNAEFSLLIDTENKACFDDYNKALLNRSLSEYILNTVAVEPPDSIEIHYFPKDIFGKISIRRLDGFSGPGITDAKALLSNGIYDVHIICKYLNSSVDFSAIDASGFFPESPVSSLSISFVNFKSAKRITDKDFYNYNGLNLYGEDAHYRLSDVLHVFIEPQQLTDSTMALEAGRLLQTYSHYESQTLNGMEFVWDSTACALDFESTKDSVTISYEEINPGQYDFPPRVYCFMDRAFYKERMDIITTVENDVRQQTRTLEWRTNDYLFFWLAPSTSKAIFELTPDF